MGMIFFTKALKLPPFLEIFCPVCRQGDGQFDQTMVQSVITSGTFSICYAGMIFFRKALKLLPFMKIFCTVCR